MTSAGKRETYKDKRIKTPTVTFCFSSLRSGGDWEGGGLIELLFLK